MAATEDLTPDQYREKQAAEYGKYVANKTIRINGVPAFNAGDLVPAGHVDRKDAPVDKADVDLINEKKG